MYLDSPGIVFRQVKTTGSRRMILLFTRKYGKISAGAQARQRKGGKSSSLRPFSYGDFHIFQGRNYYNIDREESLGSFYGIGQDMDKYTMACYVMELTEKVVPEELPQPGVFDLLIEFLQELQDRKSAYDTLLLAFEVKLMVLLGTYPETKQCVRCGKKEELKFFSVKDGGVMCGSCGEKKIIKGEDSLIFPLGFDIVDVIDYYASRPIRQLRKLALEEDVSSRLKKILREYISYHLDIGELRSESILSGTR